MWPRGHGHRQRRGRICSIRPRRVARLIFWRKCLLCREGWVCKHLSVDHTTELECWNFRRHSVGVVKLSTVSTGNLKRSLAVQLRPINRVVYPGSLVRKGRGILVLAKASRLDAFSVYPFRTWLPGRAASATTRTPGVRPSQSSRTREGVPSRFPRAQQIGTDLAHAGLNPARVPL